MSHVNGNDIDDLFRRASEKYPLKVGIGDWPSVAADLEKDPSLVLPPISDEGDRRRRKRFLWLLLLLPLGGLGYLFGPGKGSTVTSIGATIPTGQPAIAKGSNSPTIGTTASSAGATAPTEGITPSTGGAPASGSQTTISKKVTAAKEKTATVGFAVPNQGINATNKQTVSNKGGIGSTSVRASATTGGNTSRIDYAVAGGSGASTSGSADGTSGTTGFTAAGGGSKVKGGSNGANGGSAVDAAGGSTVAAGGDRDPRYAGLLTQRAAVGGDVDLTVNVQGRPGSTATVAGKNNLQKLSQKKQTSFYIGLLASPDLSTVKMQSIKGVGTTFSFLLGYNINRHWAIETGLSLDRKKYYTQGEYFSKEHLMLYPGYDLLNVDGVCNMWELPINVRYNFGEGNKVRWFATAGMSTYFMNKENYSYQTENMATGAVGGFSHTFAHPTQYPFSVINLSMGYEQSLGKIGNLRLEPYLRVPLAGIGTGSLPIMSAGLNIGITRRIW